MRDDLETVNCPTCGNAVSWTAANPHRPFCGERCQLIDLGEWAAERYRVPGEPGPPADKPDSESPQ